MAPELKTEPMEWIERTRCDGPFEEYRIRLTDEERTTRVDARTFRALSLAESIRRRWGLLAALLAAVPLAVWCDCRER